MAFKAPCDLIVDAIEDEAKRKLVRGLLFYTMNTRGGVPSDAARWLASHTTEQLDAMRIAVDRRCDELREREARQRGFR